MTLHQILTTPVTPYYFGNGKLADENEAKPLAIKDFIRHVKTSKKDYGCILNDDIIRKGSYRSAGFCWNFCSYLKRWIIHDMQGNTAVYFAPSKKMLLSWLSYSNDLSSAFDTRETGAWISELKQEDYWSADDIVVLEDK